MFSFCNRVAKLKLELFQSNSSQKYNHDCVLKDAEPSVTIECNPNEGWEEDKKNSELTRAVRRVIDSTLDVNTKLEPKDVHTKVEPKEVRYFLIFFLHHRYYVTYKGNIQTYKLRFSAATYSHRLSTFLKFINSFEIIIFDYYL